MNLELQQTKRLSVQASWPGLTCYGCGPANEEGLHLESHAEDGFLVATFVPEEKFNVVPGVVYGGLLASLIDCHSMWTAMHFAKVADGRPPDSAPSRVYVTGELKVRYLKPTPLGVPLHLKSRVEGDIGRKTRVLCELGPEGDVTATGDVIAIHTEGFTPGRKN